MKPQDQAIRELHARWINAVNAGDLPTLLTFMANDVVFLSPHQPPADRAGFSVAFPAAHQQARICCLSELEEIVVAGEIAYARSRDSLSVTPHDAGPTTHFAGYRLTIYRLDPTGHWLLARDAHTLMEVGSPLGKT